MNVLITSISKKIPLIHAVREACQRCYGSYKIFGADSLPDVIGRYFVDFFWEMPLLSELSIGQLLDFCANHDIKVIIPTRDGELTFFAEFREKLLEHDVHVMISQKSSVKTCLDKLVFFRKAEQDGLPIIPTFLDSAKVPTNRLVVKERFGAGASKIGLNLTSHEAKACTHNFKKPIYQPYIKGEEFSIDMYVDQGGELKGVIPRKRDLVINGESQITTTVMNEQLVQLGERFCTYFSFYGHVMLQVLLDENGIAHIIECNPRFGGASTLSIAAGLDSFYWFFREASGNKLNDISFIRPNSEQRMIRFPQDRFLE